MANVRQAQGVALVPWSRDSSSPRALESASGRVGGFEWLRFGAIVAVVCIHVTDVALRKNAYFADMTAEATAYYGLSTVLRFCVPVFFMMSAFLVETRALRGGPSPQSRWLRYFRPLVAASLVYTAVGVGGLLLLRKPIEPGQILVAMLTGQAACHTWFLVNVLAYALLHDRLRPLASPRVFPLVAGAYVVLFTLTLGRVKWIDAGSPFGQVFVPLVMALPYYVGGIWAAHNSARLAAVGSSVKVTAVTVGLALSFAYGVLLRERGFFNPGTVLLSAGLFVTAYSSRAKKPGPLVRQLAAFSLGIYLWHLLILIVFRAAQGRYYREASSPGLTFAIVVAETIAALFGALLIARLLSRFPALQALAR